MSYIKKSYIFIIIILGILFCFLKIDSCLTTPIVSNPDSQISFSTEQKILEQTWQPQVKKIAGIKIPYTVMGDFGTTVELKIYSDDYEELLTSAVSEQQFTEDETGVLEFEFSPVKVIPGERYRIQIEYLKCSSLGGLLIPSGSNYGGCTIDGVEYNEAVAFDVIFVKNSRLFWLLAVFFPLLSFSMLFMVAFGRKWEETVGISLIIEVFCLYVFGLLGQLSAGVTVLYILSAIALLSAMYLFGKKRMSVKDLVSPGLFVYGVLFVVIFINCRGSWLADRDEYVHWGLAVKDMFYYDSFAKHFNTTVALPRYLPFSTLAEYLFVRANGLFSQELLYIAYQTVLLSTLIITCKAAKEKLRYVIPALVIMILTPVIFFGDVYNSIYVDPMLAVFVAYVLICYFSEEMSLFNLLRIAGGLFALATTKDMGMVIAGLLTMVMLGDRVALQIRQRKLEVGKLCLPCVLAVWVLVSFFSWQIYMSIPVTAPVVESPTQEEEMESVQEAEQIAFADTASASGITVSGIRELLTGQAEEYKYQAIKNYLVTMFDGDMIHLGNIELSYIDIQIVLLVVVGLLGYLKFWKEKKEKIYSFAIFICLSGLIYCAVLEIMYLFAFGSLEALYLSSYRRYLGSWMAGAVMAMLCLIILQASENDQNEKQSGWVLTMLLAAGIIVCFPMHFLVEKNMDTEVTENMVYGYDGIAEVFRSVSKRGEKVYFVCNNSNGYSYYIFKNAVCPMLVSESGWDIYESEEAYGEQLQKMEDNEEKMAGLGQILPIEEWGNRLRGYQYVVVFHPNDVFAENYGALFDEPETIDDGTIYRVNKSGNSVALSYIGKTGVIEYK